MNEDKSKLKLIGEIAQANNKNLELIQEINELQDKLDSIKFYIEQSDIKNMIWGKEILEIIGGNND